ncbi:MAG TPA: protein-export chaperone SecB [Geminicoccaceae bacterium]|nr:protein-export chaperone SecB [Geminicoccaceae bacterium]
MAETAQTPQGGAASAANPPRLMIQTQYVKDLSFENPRAPASLDPGQGRPEIQVQVDVRATALGSERYEVVLQLHVDAKAGGETGFVMELVYGGLFGLVSIPPDSLQALLLIECPRLLFPFARRIIADTTRDGGFPPLMLDPIDFVSLYRRRQQQAEAQAQAQGGGEPVPNPIVGDGQNS